MSGDRPSAGASPSSLRDSGISLREVQEVARQLNDLLAELQDTSRRIAAQIDNRYAKLDAMVAEADGRIRRLEQLLGQDALPGATPASSPPAVSPQPAALSNPRHQPIYDLADQGKTPREIAQQLGTPPGEVELILNLRGKQNIA